MEYIKMKNRECLQWIRNWEVDKCLVIIDQEKMDNVTTDPYLYFLPFPDLLNACKSCVIDFEAFGVWKKKKTKPWNGVSIEGHTNIENWFNNWYNSDMYYVETWISIRGWQKSPCAADCVDCAVKSMGWGASHFVIALEKQTTYKPVCVYKTRNVWCMHQSILNLILIIVLWYMCSILIRFWQLYLRYWMILIPQLGNSLFHWSLKCLRTRSVIYFSGYVLREKYLVPMYCNVLFLILVLFVCRKMPWKILLRL